MGFRRSVSDKSRRHSPSLGDGLARDASDEWRAAPGRDDGLSRGGVPVEIVKGRTVGMGGGKPLLARREAGRFAALAGAA
ncbi:hypothetical protein AvCA_03660 [Azotobacter vinelandii CA]|uniref:Uncharacterized protein n=2 Tax=Azotobacter vinelandii TaxID=354 RepID=C1DIC9_AZOVD|nr:hypothetical protein Avin_03660 [Azotobacter vinelandii DJ]AGK15630.1 hypothetical protein AvCA_03660 [Azotobacter vinelandii CA]AGK19246.1 hypothetical protein AvCA6_03660 [Azotobacter vinelandii CA6]GLK58802.1 hypothetical protein GCM10017624_09590 [Azotobacter vinelandii]